MRCTPPGASERPLATDAEHHLWSKTLHYIDLNAVSPTTSAQLAAVFDESCGVIFYDGVISGGVPHPKKSDESSIQWHCPTLLMSGPNRVQDLNIREVLNLET